MTPARYPATRRSPVNRSSAGVHHHRAGDGPSGRSSSTRTRRHQLPPACSSTPPASDSTRRPSGVGVGGGERERPFGITSGRGGSLRAMPRRPSSSHTSPTGQRLKPGGLAATAAMRCVRPAVSGTSRMARDAREPSPVGDRHRNACPSSRRWPVDPHGKGHRGRCCSETGRTGSGIAWAGGWTRRSTPPTGITRGSTCGNGAGPCMERRPNRPRQP